METVKRQHDRINRGTSIPYGTLAGASQELIKVYYAYGYRDDSMLPELPCVPYEYKEYVDPEEEVHKKEMVGVVQDVLETLTPRVFKVLCLRFGIGLTQDYTLEEVGSTFDVTRERIRQIEAKALRDLKHPSRSEKLRELLGYFQTTTQKKAEEESTKTRWKKAREKAREREEAEKKAKAHAKLKAELFEKELEKVYQEDLRLRAKWEEIKPMVSDVAWVEHLRTSNHEMYQELKYMVGDIWGKNATIVWDMYAEKGMKK
jgi:RNA polymerase sigma factor (sigma-70 family)